MAIQTCPKCGAKNRVNERAASINQAVCGKCGAKLPEVTATAPGTSNAKPQVVTDASFASEVVSASASLPVLVDCWAPWCGPCRMIAPSLDQLAAESGGRYKIVKLNVDENPQTSLLNAMSNDNTDIEQPGKLKIFLREYGSYAALLSNIVGPTLVWFGLRLEG